MLVSRGKAESHRKKAKRLYEGMAAELNTAEFSQEDREQGHSRERTD